MCENSEISIHRSVNVSISNYNLGYKLIPMLGFPLFLFNSPPVCDTYMKKCNLVLYNCKTIKMVSLNRYLN